MLLLTTSSLLCVLLISGTQAQQAGSLTNNEVLNLPMEECDAGENCRKVSTSAVLDANWRWIHDDGYTNCYTGNTWDSGYCPDAQSCTENCYLEGVSAAEYRSTYGISTSGDSMTLKFVTEGQYSKNIGSRTYLLDSNPDQYYMFYLLNKEFTFTVDVSELPCGLNGALYFVEMEEDGGLKYPGNNAGPSYGTGYCDAQCPHDIKWINGEANCEDWSSSDNDANAGKGKYGSCCYELDIWEANSMSSAYTNHPCGDISGQFRCEGIECGDNDTGDRFNGVCDKDGCDYNHWRQGDKTYFGVGSNFAVDSSKPMTVVTQFHTDDGTDTGELVEIRRLYVQDGKVIENSITQWDGMGDWDSITQEMCNEQKVVFEDPDDHGKKGGLKAMSDSLARGHVLVMSLWDDHDVNMLWLDSDYPLDRDPSEPGVSRGPCSRDSGDPSDMENNYPNAQVKFSKIRVGPHGSTYPGGSSPTTTKRPTPAPTTTDGGSGGQCPGGHLDVCISLCPTQPADLFQNCVNQCMEDCS